MSKTIRISLLVALLLLSASMVVVATTTYTDWLAPGNSEDHYYTASASPLPTSTVVNTLNVTGEVNLIRADVQIYIDSEFAGDHTVFQERVDDFQNWGGVAYSTSTSQENKIIHHFSAGEGGQAYFKTTISD